MKLDYAELARACAMLARDAGRAIMAIYDEDFTIERKRDNTPLTAADLAAHHLILNGLAAIATTIPVLSEESADETPWSTRREWTRYFLVDPLDGTREFIKRNGEFTVNIALIENGVPTLGIVYAPALGELYVAWHEGGAWFESDTMMQSGKVQLSARARGAPLVIAGSRSHGDARLAAALEKLGAHELVALGSSLKFCRVAQGRADLYIRFGPTSEWDTAAGQCVLEQAGGRVCRLDGESLRYNTKESLLNPDFFACGDASLDWAALLHVSST